MAKGNLKIYLCLWAAVICLLIVSISSCRVLEQRAEEQQGLPQAETETGRDQEAGADSIPVTKIELWDYMGAKERLALMESVEEFSDINPDLNIEIRHIRSEEELLDQFEAACLAGAGPDMVLVDLPSVQKIAPSSLVREISDMNYSIFLDGLSEISEFNGIKYIIPFRATEFMVFYYNQDYLDSEPGSFEEIIEYCDEVNDFQEQIYGFVLNHDEPDWIIPFIGGYSDWIVDYANYSLSLENGGVEETLKFLSLLYDPQEPLAPQVSGFEEMDAMFRNGNAHMIINSFKAREGYLEDRINLGLSVIPEVYGEGSQPTPIVSGTGFMLNANSFGEELEASQKFIDFMLSVEQQVNWTKNTDTFPAVIAAGEDAYFKDDQLLNSTFSQAKLCRGVPPSGIIRVIRDSLRINIPEVLSEDIPAEDAVKKIHEDALRLKSGSISIEELREESLQQ